MISGQVGVALDGTVPSTGEGQVAQAFANLRAVLTANGMAVENIVKTTVFLTDRGLLPIFRSARSAVFRRSRTSLHAAVRCRAGRPALRGGDRSRGGGLTWTCCVATPSATRCAERQGCSGSGRLWFSGTMTGRSTPSISLLTGLRGICRSGPGGGRPHRRLWSQLRCVFHRLAGLCSRRLCPCAGKLRADRRRTVLHRPAIRLSAGADRRVSVEQIWKVSSSRDNVWKIWSRSRWTAPRADRGGPGRCKTTPWRRSSIHPARRRRPRAR